MKQNLLISRGGLDGVEAFLRVAALRSFSAAAIDLGVSPSAISQTIRALEDRVGVALLTRTTRSVGLTQAGELFLERAAPAFSGMNDAFAAARTLRDTPAGRLRINLPRAVVQHLFAPILAGFCDAYPDIELDIVADDGFIDVAAGGFDAGVRLGEALQADMIAVRLSTAFPFCVVGTPDYFTHHGRPSHPNDLARHRCIRLRTSSGAFMGWQFRDGDRSIEVGVTGPVIVNDLSAQITAVESGIALAYMAQPNVDAQLANGQLEAVLSSYAISSDGLFLYYPDRRQVMPKLRAFIDYVREHLEPTTMARR